jgi:hypothetical protein
MDFDGEPAETSVLFLRLVKCPCVATGFQIFDLSYYIL